MFSDFVQFKKKILVVLIHVFADDYGHHIESWPDERKAHDGTLEYTSRDAHTGAHSRYFLRHKA